MQSGIRGINIKWLVRNNFGRLPSTILHIKVDLKHVVGLDGTEGVNMVGTWLLFQFLS